jgi:DNA-binding beta-propeller fold protein YncE
MDPSTGAVLGSVDPVNNDTIGSLEWDGKYIRVANVTTGAGYINTIHPATGVQLGSIPVPAGRGEGLAFDGKAFYYSVINRIYVIDKVTGGVVRSFLPPGGSCRALAYGKGWLFSGNSGTRTITVFDKNTLAVRGTIPAPGGATDACEGIAFDTLTDRLFIANQGDNTIYVVQLDW